MMFANLTTENQMKTKTTAPTAANDKNEPCFQSLDPSQLSDVNGGALSGGACPCGCGMANCNMRMGGMAGMAGGIPAFSRR
jgi:hypothetical protein